MNASGRPNTCKSRGNRELAPLTTGARVRTAYGTYLVQGNSPGKLGLMPRGTMTRHRDMVKAFGRYKMAMRPISLLVR
jgi:hypothetical protein